jgi:hydroxymethylpyrimidine pyrophosphatase-like HAD family hydrolase
MNNVMAFGDADNDADMIRDVGIGVAMENASALTRSYAKYMTLNNQEDDVACFLEKYINGSI